MNKLRPLVGGGRLLMSGVKRIVSTAFGMTDTFSCETQALKTVFSLPVIGSY